MRPTPSLAQILVVEDDIIAREIVAAHLREAGMDVVEAGTAAAAFAAGQRQAFDLVVLDVNLPDATGFHLASQLRRVRDMPIIYMTARGTVEDRLLGFQTGGDGYLVKPVDMRELLARIRVFLRRRISMPAPEGPQVVALGGWTLDLVRRELTDAGGKPVQLTRAEFDLVAALYHSATVPLHRDYLLEVVASADSTTKLRTIDVMVSRIRRKLALGTGRGPQILTKTGEGYLLLPNGR